MAFILLSAAELQHLADAKRMSERRAAEKRCASLADIWWGPALGAYRKHHRPPAYLADAPDGRPRERDS